MALYRPAKRLGFEQRQVLSVTLQPEAWKAAVRAGRAHEGRPERVCALAIVLRPGTTVRGRGARRWVWRDRIVPDLSGWTREDIEGGS